MKHTICLLVFLTLFSTSCSQNTADPNPQLQTPSGYFDTDKMELLFTTLEEKDLGLGGSLSIFKSGEEVYQNSFGLADVDNKINVYEHTKFRIASITKTFTAAIVMQLIEEQKLTLHTLLNEYFPEIPNANSITIEHLLHHRSGLRDFAGTTPSGWPHAPRTRAEMLELFINNGTDFRPGRKAGYSNTNYVLLAFIVEEIDNKTYAEVIQDRIANPLNLSKTYFGGTINSANDEALSYSIQNGNWILDSETDTSVPHGAGAIVSTPHEVNIFYHALFNQQLISQSSLEQMQSIVDGFGMGLFLIPVESQTSYGHTGRIDGFQTIALHFPEENVTLTYLSNGVSMPLVDVVAGMVAIYFGYEYTLP